MIIVGELNPYGADPKLALFHLPPDASGGRLKEILQMSTRSYLQITKINLCEGAWSLRNARDAAFGVMMKAREGRHRTVVMLGKRVRQAFCADLDFFQHQVVFHPTDATPGLKLALLPHPSGLNRIWNDPTAAIRARKMIRELEPELPIGADA